MNTKEAYSYIITELPRNKINNKIIWKQVVGMTLQIKYGNDIYDIKVINKDKKRLTIQYQDKICDIIQDQLLNGGIGKITSKYVIDYRFKTGDIIEDEYGNIQILELLKRNEHSHHKKEYKYKCLKCGYEGTISELNIINKNARCQACCKNPKILVKGINTLGSLYPDLIKYLYDKNDADLYLPGSAKKIKTQCLTCKHIHEIVVNKLVTKGFHCPQCYSTNSYPNKLMLSILQSLNTNFEYEKTFKWSNKKRYDFYLPDCECIIEMHGSGHYYGIHDTSVETIRKNDNYKKDLAIKNGIKNYIEIDCRKENLQYIKNSITKHPLLKKVLNISKINFELCDNNINPDITKNILDKWNLYHNVTDIAKDLKLSKHIIRRRLKVCSYLGLIHYDSIKQINSKNRKEVFDSVTNTKYESISMCSKKLNVSRDYIRKHQERFIIKSNI